MKLLFEKDDNLDKSERVLYTIQVKCISIETRLLLLLSYIDLNLDYIVLFKCYHCY